MPIGAAAATLKVLSTTRVAFISIEPSITSFFFFQAEDGIRDYKVTGVQTCALPISLGPEYFGEGITDWKGSLLQLTWKNEIAFVYDINTFERTKTWAYTGEGWGLTHDATRIIMSDGTAQLRFIDPA